MVNLVMFGLAAIALGSAYFIGRHDGEAAGKRIVEGLLKSYAEEGRVSRARAVAR